MGADSSRWIASLICAAALLAGCEKVQRHASLNVGAQSGQAGWKPGHLEGAVITLLSGEGTELAQLAYGGFQTFYLHRPAQYSCLREVDGRLVPEQGERWQDCIRKQGRWIEPWIEKVAVAQVEAKGCPPIKLPVRLRKVETAWWEVWVPLPHLWSDALFTHYYADLHVKSLPCGMAFE